MTAPLVSVIIPTANRPAFLPRAVDSALAGMAPAEIEVIVVPNGSDQSWRESVAKYRDNPSVRILPIEIGHANVARNHGLRHARGKYVRFLDDDDYLIPDLARKQLEYALDKRAEFCSARLANVDADGVDLGLVSFPDTTDFVCATCQVSGFTLPLGNLILRSCLAGVSWNVNAPRRQDYIWMIDLAAQREWRWVHFEDVVGVWWQHPGQRVSTVSTASDRPNDVVDIILGLWQQLMGQGRMTEERATALAEALWYFIHRFFPYAPRYWARIAKLAMAISSQTRPRHLVFNNVLLRSVKPLLAEWLMFPMRLISIHVRKVRHALFEVDYRRRL